MSRLASSLCITLLITAMHVALGGCGDDDSYVSGEPESSLLYVAEGNRLRRFDIDTIKNPPLLDDILI